MHHHPLNQATRRNFRMNVTNGAIMMATNNSVASPDLVMTTFAAHLTDNPLILGIIAPLPGAVWSLPQLFMIKPMQRLTRSMFIYQITALLRVIMWAVLIAAALFSTDNTLLLLSMFGFITIAGLASGFSGLPFIEITGKTIPPHQRGHLFGLRTAIGGLLAIGGSQVVLVLTGPGARFDFPTSYGLLFLFAALAQIMGMIAFMRIEEPDAPSNVKHQQPSLAMLRTIWRTDGNFRRYVRGQTFLVFAGMSNGLVIVYANQALGVRLEMAGAYLFASSLLSPAISMLAGRYSAQTGNRMPVAAAMVLLSMSWLLLLLGQPLGVRGGTAEVFMFLVYGLLALHKGLLFSNLMALGLNITPEDDHALYMGIVNTWVGLLLLATTMSGVIAKTIGYEALFAITLLCALISAWQFSSLFEDWKEANA